MHCRKHILELQLCQLPRLSHCRLIQLKAQAAFRHKSLQSAFCEKPSQLPAVPGSNYIPWDPKVLIVNCARLPVPAHWLSGSLPKPPAHSCCGCSLDDLLHVGPVAASGCSVHLQQSKAGPQGVLGSPQPAYSRRQVARGTTQSVVSVLLGGLWRGVCCSASSLRAPYRSF